MVESEKVLSVLYLIYTLRPFSLSRLDMQYLLKEDGLMVKWILYNIFLKYFLLSAFFF